MAKKEKKKGIPFRKFLNNSSNLFTVFGIFNALFIYSNTIENESAAQFLLPTFYLLSIMVWLEIVILSFKSANGNWRYELFYTLSAMVLLGLSWYFISIFSPLVLSLLVILVYFLLTYLVARLLLYLIRPAVMRLNEKIRNIIAFITVLVSMLLMSLILKYGIPFLNTSLEEGKNEQTEIKNENKTSNVIIIDTTNHKTVNKDTIQITTEAEK